MNPFLPLANREMPGPQKAPLDGEAFKSSNIRILVVEDDDRLRKLSRRFLEGRGWAVQEAEDSESGLRILDQAECDPDIVITDVVLPGCTGPEWIARARTRHPGISVLYVSGYAPPDVDDTAPVHGVAWLQKPYSFQTLIHQVEALLAQRHA